MLKIPRDTSVSMPERLRLKLSAIPRLASQVSCDEVDRLYEAALRQARGAAADPSVVEHLESCPACQKLYGTLGAAFRPARRPLPQRLTRRLRSTGVRAPHLSWLARDSRLAVAASLLLTASLMLLVGDPAALARGTAETVGARAMLLAEVSEERGQALWEGVTDGVEEKVARGREILADQGRSCEELWSEARKLYKPEEWRRLLGSLTMEGDGPWRRQ